MARGKQTEAKDKVKLTCTSCGKDKDLDHYYSSYSPFHKNTGKLHVCKECYWEFIGDDVNKLKVALRMIDKPFIIDLLRSSHEEAERGNKNAIKLYMKNIGMLQYKGFTWDDSDFDGFQANRNSLNIDNVVSEPFEIDNEIIKYWGKGYLDLEYEFLEDERIKLMSSFECPDYGMEMIMRDICFINLDIEKVRQERKTNSGTEITKLIKTRSDLMNDANMKPIQSTGADASDQVTFGTLIKKWENERPIPKPLEDEMKEYIDTFMVGHLAKMEGLNNEATDKYDKAISEYTINFNDINRDKDEIED